MTELFNTQPVVSVSIKHRLLGMPHYILNGTDILEQNHMCKLKNTFVQFKCTNKNPISKDWYFILFCYVNNFYKLLYL